MQKFFILFLLCIMTLLACDEKPNTCKEQSSWLIKFGFFKSVRPASDSVLKSFQAVLPAFSYTKTARNIRNFTMPMSQSADSTVMDVTVNGTLNATLVIYYRRERIFENYRCGFRTNFVLDTVISRPRFCDSIKIIQPYITDVNQENCRFYFSTDSTRYK